jgi:hypothetical protein
MHRLLRPSLLAAAALTLAAGAAEAQLPLLDVRVGAHAVLPTGDLGDAYDAGFGAYGRIGLPVGPVKLMASATFNRFTGVGSALTGDLDVVSVQVGPHFGLAMLDVGLEGGWFSQFQDMGFAPNVSLKLLRFEVTASYSTTFKDPTGAWMTLGAGFRF